MGWLRRNVALSGPRELSPWRNLALVAWDSASAASVHAVVEVEADPMLSLARQELQRTGIRVTTIHVVGRAVAEVLRYVYELKGKPLPTVDPAA